MLPCVFILRLWWHACQSFWRSTQASPPAAPVGLWTRLGLIGGQSGRHWGESVWRSNWRQRWDRKTTWRAERNRKHTGTEEQCGGTVWSELRTALISASQIAGITHKCGKSTFVQICSEFSGSTLSRTDGEQQWAALDWLFYALSLKWMCAFYSLLISHVEQCNRKRVV